MTAIVNDFLALQASFKAYEEKRQRDLFGSKDEKASENAEGSATGRLWEVSVFDAGDASPQTLDKSKQKFDTGFLLAGQKMYPVVSKEYGESPLRELYQQKWVITDEDVEAYKKKDWESFRIPKEMMRPSAQPEDWRARYGYRPGCTCGLCRAISNAR